jgi:hypothetical protein
MSEKVIDISIAIAERDELTICRLWDKFQKAAEELYSWRDYESLLLLLKAIDAVKWHIVKHRD